MANLRNLIDRNGGTGRVLISPEIDLILNAFEVIQETATQCVCIIPPRPQNAPPPALPGFPSLILVAERTVTVTVSTGATGFQVQFDFSGQDQALFELSGVPGRLSAAHPRSSGSGATRQEWLELSNNKLLVFGELLMRITGTPNTSATTHLLPRNSTEGLISLRLDPPAMLFGATEFGISLPNRTILLDDRPTPPGQVPAWHGLSVSGARLYVPRGVPLVGGTTLPVDFGLASPAGLNTSTNVHLPAADGRLDLTATVEYRDPTATTFGDCLPTLIDITVLLPVAGSEVSVGGKVLPLGGGDPVRVKVRYVRDPRNSDPATVGFSAGLEADGEQGVLAVRAGPGDPLVAKTVVTAAALATAFMADTPKPPPRPNDDGSGALLSHLLVAAGGLSAVLTEQGQVVVHGVTFAYSTSSVLDFALDYSVDIVVRPLTVGGATGFGVRMDPDRPMRVRFREVRLRVDLTASGLDMFNLDYRPARVDVEDPGGWQVQHLGSLFDVLGTRSGKGSTWFEVDLAFALDLGPMKVSGATIRATFTGSAQPDVALRGLAVSLAFPGGPGPNLIEGSGQVQIVPDDDTGDPVTDIHLAARIPPLNLAAEATLLASDHGERGTQLLVSLGANLPAPIPLGPTGLGVFGFRGVFGTNTAISLPAGDDVIARQLSWDPARREDTRFESGSTTLGLGVVLGTVPDLGYTFSGRAMFALSVPDLAIVASLKGKLFAERTDINEIGTDPGESGINYLGSLAYDSTGFTAGLSGSYRVPHLVDLTIPVGAHFPRHDKRWFLRIGDDGNRGGSGPVLLTVLPDILDEHAWAFLMIEGGGLENFPEDGKSLHGFAIGFGARWHRQYGFGPLGLEIDAAVAAGIGTLPYPGADGHSVIVAAKGHLSGDLDFGPVSVGISTDLTVDIGPGLRHVVDFVIQAEVDLYFFSATADIHFRIANPPNSPPPEIPDQSPLTGVQLTDRLGRTIGKAEPTEQDAPTVWPDVVPVLVFSAAPKRLPATDTSYAPFEVVEPEPVNTGVVGSSSFQFTYFLRELRMFKITAQGQVPVTGTRDSTWWIPVTGQDAAGELTSARNLSLLSADPVPWVRSLADGGAGAPEDPLRVLRDVCGPGKQVQPAWVLGADARRIPGGWRLPPEGLPANRFRGRFGADVSIAWDGVPFQAPRFVAAGIHSLIHPGGRISYPSPLTSPDRSFAGALVLPRQIRGLRTSPSGGATAPVATVRFSEQLSQVRVWLRRPVGEHQPNAAVFSLSSGSAWIQEQTFTTGEQSLVAYVPPDGASHVGFRIEYNEAFPIELVGIRGVTSSAVTNRDLANAARADTADFLHGVAGRTKGYAGNLLEPDSLYMIGAIVGAMRPGDTEITPLPPQMFYFRTAAAAPSVRTISATSYATRFQTVNRFDPSYLERYLLGYLPGDGTRFWFHQDPVAVSFSQDHIMALAGLYDYHTLLRLRRTDTPPGMPDTIPDFVPRVVAVLAPHLFGPADRRIHDLAVANASFCPIPSPGASLVANTKLAPSAQYDLAVRFRRRPPASGADVALPGVVFSTSRYGTALDLFASLGFRTGTPGTPHGDLAVSSPTTLPPPSTGNNVFERVLRDLGLDPRPAPAARTSALWVRIGWSWTLSGILLECPEPIERLGEGQRVRLGALVGTFTFGQVWRDTSGCRVLFRTTEPIYSPWRVQLTITEQRPLSAGGVQTVTSTLYCALNWQPRFVEDVS